MDMRKRSPGLAFLLGVALTAGQVIAPTSRANANSNANIPGVPLPGVTVTGELGGPIYDQVFSIDVPAARVILLSLTGTPGTNFDLYLFDATATTVYTNVGLLASSTGPTSTESISYPTVSGGRFYIDLNGATNVEGTFRLVTRLATDTTPPTVSISLDGGAPATRDATVNVTVSASDDLSGVAQTEESSDGVTWGAWQEYTPTLTWTFPGGDGRKDLYVRVSDGAGNVSATAHASILLDTTAPLVVGHNPSGADAVTGLQPTLSVTFSKPILASTWLLEGLILQDAQSTVIYGTYAYDAASNTGTFVPSVPLVPGASYVVTLGSVTDLAGNPVAPVGGWIIHPLIEPSVTLRASKTVVEPGSLVSFSGVMSPPVDGAFTLEALPPGGPWQPVTGILTNPDGSFRLVYPATVSLSYRAHYTGTSITAEAVSPVIRVVVRREVALAGASASTIRQVTAYARQELTAVLTPSGPDTPVTLSIYRYVAGRGYSLQTSVTRTTASGRVAFSWHPGRGVYYVRFTTPSSALFANGISAAYFLVAH
jgi:hypothetical protein